MLGTQYAAAIGCARGNALDEIMREVWTRYSAGQLSEEDAGQLSALAQERRATSVRQAFGLDDSNASHSHLARSVFVRGVAVIQSPWCAGSLSAVPAS